MLISISNKKLVELVVTQIKNLFGLEESEKQELCRFVGEALKKIEYCFSFCSNKYYRRDDSVFFNPLHSAQYAIFLYFLSRALSAGGNGILADKVYYLNRTLNAVDLYHEIELPDVFCLDHPIGSVMGRAKYSNFFSFLQNCTVGNNRGVYPSFRENVALMAGATVLGNSHIGSNCIISANTFVIDQDVPSNSVVFGHSPDLVIKEKEEDYFWENRMFSSTVIS